MGLEVGIFHAANDKASGVATCPPHLQTGLVLE